MLISPIRLLEPNQKQDRGIAQGCPRNPHRVIHTKCPLSPKKRGGRRNTLHRENSPDLAAMYYSPTARMPAALAAHLLKTVRPCTVSRLVVAQIAQCSGSKCFGASAQCGLEPWGEVRAVVGNILSFFAAGKYPEAIGNPIGSRNGGEILAGC